MVMLQQNYIKYKRPITNNDFKLIIVYQILIKRTFITETFFLKFN